MKTQPQRMCIVCRKQGDKKNFIRVVRNREGEIKLDFTGKAAGRGAYLCDDAACIVKCAKTRALNRAFGGEIPQSVYEELTRQYDLERK